MSYHPERLNKNMKFVYIKSLDGLSASEYEQKVIGVVKDLNSPNMLEVMIKLNPELKVDEQKHSLRESIRIPIEFAKATATLEKLNRLGCLQIITKENK
jgi:hypothetical protein